MTLVGKILTVMIAVMSVLFMSFTIMTYMTHRNWRNVVEGKAPLGLKFQLENAQNALTAKQAEMESVLLALEQEKAARTKTVAALEIAARDLQERLEAQEIKLTNEEAEKNRSIQIAETAQTEMQRLKEELESVRESLKTTLDDRNDKLARVTQLNDQLSQTRTKLAQLTEQDVALRNSLARAKLVLDRNGLDEHMPVDNIPPTLDGVVTSVRESNFVEVSLGADEGLRRGHKLEIYRQDGSYIGRVVVVETNSDRAVARIVPEFRQGEIRRGDRVATNLL